MSSKKNCDHVFFLEIKGRDKLSIAFCDSTNCDRYMAYEKVKELILSKNIRCFKLSYLGLLDYSSMDPEIVDQLHYFIKSKDVWLLL